MLACCQKRCFPSSESGWFYGDRRRGRSSGGLRRQQCDIDITFLDEDTPRAAAY